MFVKIVWRNKDSHGYFSMKGSVRIHEGKAFNCLRTPRQDEREKEIWYEHLIISLDGNEILDTYTGNFWKSKETLIHGEAGSYSGVIDWKETNKNYAEIYIMNDQGKTIERIQ